MEYLTLVLFTLAGCALSTLPPTGEYQSSMFNGLTAGLAVDGDPKTCMETGFERGAWWATVMNAAVNVTGVTIHGLATAVQVRVGDNMDYHGTMGNFGPNSLCKYSPGIETGANVYQCESEGVEGRVISVQAVDPAYSEKLRLCEITMHYGS